MLATTRANSVRRSSAAACRIDFDQSPGPCCVPDVGCGTFTGLSGVQEKLRCRSAPSVAAMAANGSLCSIQKATRSSSFSRRRIYRIFPLNPLSSHIIHVGFHRARPRTRGRVLSLRAGLQAVLVWRHEGRHADLDLATGARRHGPAGVHDRRYCWRAAASLRT